jgi:hypothetical protein
MIAVGAKIVAKGKTRNGTAVRTVCCGIALTSLILTSLGASAAESGASPSAADRVRAMQKQACEAISQLIITPVEENLKRAGYVYECEALPAGEVFTLIGKLHVSGSGGPTQAQFLGTLKPASADNTEDWTLCALSLNGAPVEVPSC